MVIVKVVRSVWILSEYLFHEMELVNNLTHLPEITVLKKKGLLKLILHLKWNYFKLTVILLSSTLAHLNPFITDKEVSLVLGCKKKLNHTIDII